jgi:hypothetical protein
MAEARTTAWVASWVAAWRGADAATARTAAWAAVVAPEAAAAWTRYSEKLLELIEAAPVKEESDGAHHRVPRG